MKAVLIYEVECPQEGCSREEFLQWLELSLFVPGACVTSDNPLYSEYLDFETSEFTKLEVIDG